MSPEQKMAEVLTTLGYGQDPECRETARRVTELLRSWAPAGSPPVVEACEYRGMSPIVLRDLRFYSLCAHHLLPFFGTCDVVHRPDGTIAGLGYFPKALQHFSHRPQIQERLCEQLGLHLHESLGGSLLVRIRARHMCMEMRGTGNGAEVETFFARGPHNKELLDYLR